MEINIHIYIYIKEILRAIKIYQKLHTKLYN